MHVVYPLGRGVRREVREAGLPAGPTQSVAAACHRHSPRVQCSHSYPDLQFVRTRHLYQVRSFPKSFRVKHYLSQIPSSFHLVLLHLIGDKGSCNCRNTDVSSVKLSALEALLLLNTKQCQLICFSRSRQGLGGFVVAPLWRVIGRRGSTHTRAQSSPSFSHNCPESLDLVRKYAFHELFVLLDFGFPFAIFSPSPVFDIDRDNKHYGRAIIYM